VVVGTTGEDEFHRQRYAKQKCEYKINKIMLSDVSIKIALKESIIRFSLRSRKPIQKEVLAEPHALAKALGIEG
jgi:hypothetical protein